MLETLWDVSTLPRVRNCRRVSAGENTIHAVKWRDGSTASISGTQTCGSVHACPMCSARIRGERMLEITAALTAVHDQGGSTLLVTPTVPHGLSDSLTEVQELLGAAWVSIKTDRTVQRLLELGDFVGYVRGLDHTHGANGWHAHYHAHFCFSGEIHPGHAAHLREAMMAAVDRLLKRRGRSELSRDHGLTVQELTLDEAVGAAAGYLTKPTAMSTESAGYEVAGGTGKRGRDGHRTPWEILADFQDTGDEDDLKLWREFERATFGRQQLTWGGELRSLVLAPELTDEEIADQADEEGETVCEITATHLRKITAVRGRWSGFLEMVETAESPEEAFDWIELWCFGYRVPPPKRPPPETPDAP